MTEQQKTGPPATTPSEPQYLPVVPYPQGFNGAYPPVPHAPFPTFFAYPPNPDGSHPENGQNGGPPPHYMLFPPPPPGMPGMVYAYPPGAGFTMPPPPQATPTQNKPKRKQVKMACTNCAQACKRCDESRPCERCVKYGLSDTCVDGQRKERKKGIKRGPYRRKPKAPEGADRPEGEWPQPAQPIATPATTAAAIHAVAQFTTPEGYALYYPPNPYLQHPPPDGQDGSPSHTNGHPIMPLFVHPGGFPPYPYPPPGMFPSPPHPAQAAHAPAATTQPAQTISPADTSKKADDTNGATNGTTATAPPAAEAATNNKKRSRSSKGGESKSKRSKAAKGKGKEDDGNKKGAAPGVNGTAVNGDHEEGEGVDSG